MRGHIRWKQARCWKCGNATSDHSLTNWIVPTCTFCDHNPASGTDCLYTKELHFPEPFPAPDIQNSPPHIPLTSLPQAEQ
ncbi:unnamed protein product [Urochloa humidicola]